MKVKAEKVAYQDLNGQGDDGLGVLWDCPCGCTDQLADTDAYTVDLDHEEVETSVTCEECGARFDAVFEISVSWDVVGGIGLRKDDNAHPDQIEIGAEK